MDNCIIYVLGGLITVLGAFKAMDWLISQKYKTKDDCEKCRASLYEAMSTDKNLLIEINTKVTLIMKRFNLELSNNEKN